MTYVENGNAEMFKALDEFGLNRIGERYFSNQSERGVAGLCAFFDDQFPNVTCRSDHQYLSLHLSLSLLLLFVEFQRERKEVPLSKLPYFVHKVACQCVRFLGDFSFLFLEIEWFMFL